jgi:heat shock protein HslJ
MAAAHTPLARRWLHCLLALGLALAPLVSTHAAPTKKATTSATKKAPAKTTKTTKTSKGRKATAAAAGAGAAAATSSAHSKANAAEVLMPLPAVFTGTLALTCADCPPGVAYELRLQGADGESTRGTYSLHRQTVNSLAQTPLESGPWRLSYDFGRLILGGGNMPALYAIKDRNTLVQLGIEGKPLEGGQHQLQRVQTSNVPPGPYTPTAPAWTAPAGSQGLDATFWKLVQLGKAPVPASPAASAEDLQRLPHFVLQPGEQRVTGSGGCNRFAGSFERDDAQGKVALTSIVSTRVACAEEARTLLEVRFFDALQQTRRYRLMDSTRLDLLDEAGGVLAQFEAMAAPAAR